jgi:hypothetical protein
VPFKKAQEQIHFEMTITSISATRGFLCHDQNAYSILGACGTVFPTILPTYYLIFFLTAYYILTIHSFTSACFASSQIGSCIPSKLDASVRGRHGQSEDRFPRDDEREEYAVRAYA